MITLTTGLPGAGKTLYTLLMVEEKRIKERREVYYHGITDLTFDWKLLDDPTQAAKLPAGAIIVIDECQSTFRPRGTGSAVPPHVAALETHRHHGHDYFLITQHPMLVDPNIRRLVGNHFHVVRKFGFEKSVIHEWKQLKESPDKNRTGSIRHDFIYPKSQYGFYKSAEIHTVKAKLPARVYFLYFGVPLLLLIFGYMAYTQLYKLSHQDTKNTETAPIATIPELPKPMAIETNAQPINQYNWYEAQVSRLPDLPQTAPKYDELTKPAIVPIPAACVLFRKKCTCYTQQATKLDTSEGVCKQIVKNGFFIDFNNQPQPANMPTVPMREPVQSERKPLTNS